MKIIATDTAAIPQGHYSQAIVHRDTVYVAMQIAIDPHKGPQPGPVASQARLALQNVVNILEAAGSSIDKALRVTIYVSDISFWEEVNEVYKDILGEHRPARGVVSVGQLHMGLDVGFEVTAAL